LPSTRLQRLAALSLVALAGLGAAGSTWAQEVELYDQGRFRGTRLRLSSDTPDLAAYGMGGGVGSVVVKSGDWEFCTTPRYGGACITVGPGRYDELPPALRGKVASLRRASMAPVAAAQPPARVLPPPIQAPATLPGNDPLVLFDGRPGTGRSLPLNGAMPRLGQAGFNDAVTWVTVRRGEWQLCEHEDFRGECITLGPGTHELPGRFSRTVSSVRPLGLPNGGMAAPVAGNPWLRPHSDVGSDAVVLFEHANFEGRQLGISSTVARLGDLGFNDMASSVIVRRGRWQLCEHADFGGQCLVLGPGRHALETVFNDRASSIRPLYGNGDQPLPRGGAIVLYEFANLGGQQVTITEPVSNLESLAMNDVATAVEVLAGQWELCTDANYSGRCMLLGPGPYVLDGTMRDRISSVRPR
jgi:hypothetical protein